jgi:hypothetical protein
MPFVNAYNIQFVFIWETSQPGLVRSHFALSGRMFKNLSQVGYDDSYEDFLPPGRNYYYYTLFDTLFQHQITRILKFKNY